MSAPAKVPKPSSRPLKVALMGTRGIPAAYGGFETALEHLGPWLAERGHAVTVYCRTGNSDVRGTYRGCTLVTLPAVRSKNWDTMTHSLLSTVHALVKTRPDVALFFGPGNAPYAVTMHALGRPTGINIDGHDWMRKKWGRLASGYLHWCERVAGRADQVIADAHVMAEDYAREYGVESTVIPYGAQERDQPAGRLMAELELKSRGYFLYVGRLEPENNAHVLVDAFKSAATRRKLVVVGDVPYETEYSARLKANADGDILFPGFVYGDGYWELGCNAYAYVQPTEVGGTHPALVEAMARGNCVVANGTPENLEVVGDAGLTYAPETGSRGLAELLRKLDEDEALVAALGEKARSRARELFSWERACARYERVILELAGQP